MKLKLSIIFSLLFFACNQDNYSDKSNWKTIQIKNYIFDFPPDFILGDEHGTDSLEVEQGKDWYGGKIKGKNMSFTFAFGRGSSTLDEYTPQNYNVINDTINNHFRKIVLGHDSKFATTAVAMKELSGNWQEALRKESLVMVTEGLTKEQQLLAFEIFKTGRPVKKK